MKAKKFVWPVLAGFLLIAVSAALYGAHFLLFGDAHHIWIYMVGDLAFVPVEVLMVTLIIHRLLSKREKRARLNKLNMAIGTFFSEVGTPLLKLLSRYAADGPERWAHLTVATDWSNRTFEAAKEDITKHDCTMDASRGLRDLREFLAANRMFMLDLLRNPNLLEHEAFTDLLWSVFHLTEELVARESVSDLPAGDAQHMAVDMKRAYVQLVTMWLDYMKHLKKDYPYLFSFAVRTNPFDPDARVTVPPAPAS